MEIQDLDDLTVSQLTVLFNTMQDTDEKPIKAFRSRKQAVDRIAALDRLAYWDARLTDDGGVEFDHYPNGSPLSPPPLAYEPAPVEVSDGEPDGQTETVDALEDAGEPFVKATKEELGAMDATQRAAYRRRRRAAARAARRLRAGS